MGPSGGTYDLQRRVVMSSFPSEGPVEFWFCWKRQKENVAAVCRSSHPRCIEKGGRNGERGERESGRQPAAKR